MSLLSDFQNYSHHEWQKMELGLHRIKKACLALGHPEKSFPSIHVAGTNGKGSVSAMLHSILSRAGYRVGLFTSPHLVRINERFRIGDEEILDEELEEVLEKIKSPLTPLCQRGDGGISSQCGLTFFELCTLIAFLFFAQKKVDVAILEVGLGGRLDATNVVTPLVSVITEISLDHTDVLGPDLASIAKEKAGIIKSKVPVVCGARDPVAKEVIRRMADENKAPVFWVDATGCHPREGGDPIAVKWIPVSTGMTSIFDWGPFKDLQLGLAGSHQIYNAAITLTALQVLRNVGAIHESPLRVEETAIRDGLANVRWPGRLEWLSRDPPILLDGAHNPAGIRTLVAFLLSPSPPVGEGGGEGDLWPKKWKILFSAAKDKNVTEMLRVLQEIAGEIKICKMGNARSIEATEGDAFKIFQTMRKELKEGEGLVVTGSLYLVGEIKMGLQTL